MAIAAMLCVAALASLLWKSRVEYLDHEGVVIPEAIPSVEQPADAAFRRCRPVDGAWVTLAAMAYLAFLASGSLSLPS